MKIYKQITIINKHDILQSCQISKNEKIVLTNKEESKDKEFLIKIVLIKLKHFKFIKL